MEWFSCLLSHKQEGGLRVRQARSVKSRTGRGFWRRAIRFGAHRSKRRGDASAAIGGRCFLRHGWRCRQRRFNRSGLVDRLALALPPHSNGTRASSVALRPVVAHLSCQRAFPEGFAMKWLLVIGAATLVGCAGTPPDPQTLARRHADNVRTAQRDGYPIVELDGRTVFCATDTPAGSHIVPPAKRRPSGKGTNSGSGEARLPGLP